MDDEKVVETTDSTSAIDKWKWKKIFGRVGLFIGLMVYTVLGGIVFKLLEHPTEVEKLAELDAKLRQHRNQFLQTSLDLYNKSDSQSDFIMYLEKELYDYEQIVNEAVEGGVSVPLDNFTAPAELAKWNHVQAIFFASTVLTTIGYGNITPVTLTGRVFCLGFALVGIPLALTVLADIGGMCATALPNVPDWITGTSTTIKSLISAFVALFILLIYLAIGSVIFMFMEDDWDFFDSFYFCFITMTTIGFGDLVPQKPEYIFFCTLYILVGLSLTSTIIEIVRLEYAKSWKRLQALAEALRRLGESGGSGADLAAIQSDLKNVLNVISGKSKDSKDWENTMSNLMISINKPKSKPKVIQIVIYETSV